MKECEDHSAETSQGCHGEVVFRKSRWEVLIINKVVDDRLVRQTIIHAYCSFA